MSDVAVTPRYSGFWRRFGGVIIDGIIVAVIAGILSFILGAIGLPRIAALVVLELIIGLIYYTWGWGTGQTVGCMALKMKLVDQDTGAAPGYSKGLIRVVVVLVLGYVGPSLNQLTGTQAFGLLGLLGLIGDLWMLWDSKKQTWQDKVAGTLVVDA